MLLEMEDQDNQAILQYSKHLKNQGAAQKDLRNMEGGKYSARSQKRKGKGNTPQNTSQPQLNFNDAQLLDDSELARQLRKKAKNGNCTIF